MAMRKREKENFKTCEYCKREVTCFIRRTSESCSVCSAYIKDNRKIADARTKQERARGETLAPIIYQ